MHLDLGFFLKFLGFLKTFELLVKFLGWVFLICCYMIMHYIPFAFSQCFMHLLNVENCVLLGLDWVEPMMQFLLARHMFMHFSCIRTLSFLSILFWVVMLCLFVSLPFSLSDRLCMAPKCKSTPSRNPLCSGTSSSDPTPTHV